MQNVGIQTYCLMCLPSSCRRPAVLPPASQIASDLVCRFDIPFRAMVDPAAYDAGCTDRRGNVLVNSRAAAQYHAEAFNEWGRKQPVLYPTIKIPATN